MSDEKGRMHFNLPIEYLKKMDEIVEWERERTGFRVTRTDILRKLIRDRHDKASTFNHGFRKRRKDD